MPSDTTPSPQEFVFYRSPVWWVMLITVTPVCIAGAFFANWALGWITLQLFAAELRSTAYSFELLWVLGAIWGLLYTFSGILLDSWEEMLFRVAVPYECLFDPGEVLLGIFTAMPLNIFFTLAIAHASAYFLGSYYDAIFYFMVVAITLVSAGAYFLDTV